MYVPLPLPSRTVPIVNHRDTLVTNRPLPFPTVPYGSLTDPDHYVKDGGERSGTVRDSQEQWGTEKNG
jgi:hypothetical protein